MERLTEWRDGHGSLIKGDGYTKLAQYEDTGLDPGEVESMKNHMVGAIYKTEDLARVAMLCLEHKENEKKKADGLSVDLPCKPGDLLYAPTRDFVSTFRVIQINISKNYMFCEWRLEDGITGEYRIDGVWADEIGKKVFLSRPEAVKELERKKDASTNL